MAITMSDRTRVANFVQGLANTVLAEPLFPKTTEAVRSLFLTMLEAVQQVCQLFEKYDFGPELNESLSGVSSSMQSTADEFTQGRPPSTEAVEELRKAVVRILCTLHGTVHGALVGTMRRKSVPLPIVAST